MSSGIKKIRKAADDDIQIDLSDLDLFGGDENKDSAEEEQEDEVPEFPIEPETDDSDEDDSAKDNSDEDDISFDDDLFSDFNSDSQDTTQILEVQKKLIDSLKKLRDEFSVYKANSDAKIAKLETDLTTSTIEFQRIQNKALYLEEKNKELREVLEKYLLHKIPSFEEIDISLANKKDFTLITKAISDALDKRFIKLFHDIPTYTLVDFSVLEEDSNGSIRNGKVIFAVEFPNSVKYKLLKFNIELWILDGILEFPKWIFYNNNIYPLSQDGINRLTSVLSDGVPVERDVINNKTTWYNANKQNYNPLYNDTVVRTPDYTFPEINTPEWKYYKKF
ncbi:MAG: hypothetical protein ABIK31_02775 [candidate division WOR-3 bacterium]